MKVQKKRVIIDLDMGTDDYLALLMLLHAEKQQEVKIEGITCCMGNASLDDVAKNVVRLLEIEKRTDIPVFVGAHEALISHKEPPLQFHGKDGFGDMDHETVPDISIINEEPAAIALNRIVNKNPEEISILCIGPLTNLALALKLNRDFRKNVNDIWIMGGNYTGVGNCTSAAEFNFYVDPEAVHIVLDCLNCPIYMIPWECCLKTNLTLEWRLTAFGPFNPAFELLTKVEKKVYTNAGLTQYMPCDAYLSFCYLNPELYILEKSSLHIEIELNSGKTRGQIVVSHLGTNEPNVVIIKSINEDLFKEYLISMNNN